VYLREFEEAGLIQSDIWGKRKVYFFADHESEVFVKGVITRINDAQLQIDLTTWIQFLKGGKLQISGWNFAIRKWPCHLFSKQCQKGVKKAVQLIYVF
jgi:hypothetical protein